MHVWQPSFPRDTQAKHIRVEPPHSHPWSFHSYVVRGSLRQYSYSTVEYAKQRERYIPHGGPIRAWQPTEWQNQTLEQDEEVVLRAGQSYHLPPSFFHSTPDDGMPSSHPAVTLLYRWMPTQPSTFFLRTTEKQAIAELAKRPYARFYNGWQKLRAVAAYLRNEQQTLNLQELEVPQLDSAMPLVPAANFSCFQPGQRGLSSTNACGYYEAFKLVRHCSGEGELISQGLNLFLQTTEFTRFKGYSILSVGAGTGYIDRALRSSLSQLALGSIRYHVVEKSSWAASQALLTLRTEQQQQADELRVWTMGFDDFLRHAKPSVGVTYDAVIFVHSIYGSVHSSLRGAFHVLNTNAASHVVAIVDDFLYPGDGLCGTLLQECHAIVAADQPQWRQHQQCTAGSAGCTPPMRSQCMLMSNTSRLSSLLNQSESTCNHSWLTKLFGVKRTAAGRVLEACTLIMTRLPV
jgi:hypothetical protein